MSASSVDHEIVDSDMTDIDDLTDRLSVTDWDDSTECDSSMQSVEDYLTTQDESFDYSVPSSDSSIPELDGMFLIPSPIITNGSEMLARLITIYDEFSWNHVTHEDIAELSGLDTGIAPLAVPEKLLDRPEFQAQFRLERLACPSPLLLPWAEYVAEEEYIRKGFDSGLNEHGGKLQQHIHLRITKSSPSTPSAIAFEGLEFNFALQYPTKSKSCRFSRRVGSRRWIQCHISNEDIKKHSKPILKFFGTKKLLILGRLYQGFYGHDGTVEIMELNEDFGREPSRLLGDHNRLSFEELVSWHNNVLLNGKQSLGKWVSRWALLFSTTLVGLSFSPYNMHSLEDLHAPGVHPEDAASHQIMTDGCGFLNLAALQAIQQTMKWGTTPTHVQARIAGAKGLFLLHPDHRDPNEKPQIWIRPSQTKIKLAANRNTWSTFHRIIDICSGPLLQYPSSITYEMILCLSAGEVPDSVLVSLLHESLKGLATGLDLSNLPHTSEILWDTVYGAHQVSQSRLREMISPEEQRVQGVVSYGENDDIDLVDTQSAKWNPKPDSHSGMPASKQEQLLGFLQAGFNPTDPWVMNALAYLQDKLMDAAIKKCRIVIPKSARAHIVPDPLGVLCEGEIYFASKQLPLEDSGGIQKHCITGPVIVSRNPCVQMWDARKVLAVNSHELLDRGYYDVIVFSTRGSCSLASQLSGGDYDGDNVVIIWDENITSHFTNYTDMTHAYPTNEFEDQNFHKSTNVLGDLVADSILGELDLELKLREALLKGATTEKREGLYNIFYRVSLYENGLSHPDTIRLGHMFTQCLDSTKSGLEVKEEVWRKDRQRWNKKMPQCFSPGVEKDECYGYSPTAKRSGQRPPFILETLQAVAKEHIKIYKDRFSTLKDRRVLEKNIDQDLIQPLKDGDKRASRFGFGDDLDKIRSHVEKYRELFKSALTNRGEFSARTRHKKRAFGHITIGEWQECFRALSGAYNLTLPKELAGFDDAAIRRIAASYAYFLDARLQNPKEDYKFSFTVAWDELCGIKARAIGCGYVTMAPGFVDSMSMNKKMIKFYRNDVGFD